MRQLRAFILRLRGLFRSRRADADFAAELQSHIAQATDDGIRAGLSPEEARRQALIRLGGAEQTRQAHRERRTLPWIETLGQDLRFGLRILLKSPGFTAVAVLTLALGIGANSAVFTVAEAALLRSWPAKEPERLARLVSKTPQGEGDEFSYADFVDLATQSRTLEGIVAYSRRGKMLRVGADTEMILDDVVSPNYFAVLGLGAAHGRVFSAHGAAHGGPEVVVSDSLWRRAFSSDASLVGGQISLSGKSYTVLGIGPPGFRGLARGVPTDLWIAVDFEPGVATGGELTDRSDRQYELIGRMRPGVAAAEAYADLDAIAGQLALAYPATNKARGVALISESERLREGMVPALLLMTAVGLVLLICCVNVAGLVLTRSDARRKEVAMRLALGAGRTRLVRQMLTEAVLLAVIGASLGLGLAVVLLKLQPVLLPPAEVELGLDLHLDAWVVAFTLAVTVLAVLVFGLVPAIQSSKTNFASALKGEERVAGRTAWRLTARNVMVAGEIALSVVLLTASGLVVRSLLFTRSIPLGFDNGKQLVFFDFAPGLAGYDAQRSLAYFQQVEEKAASLPGVRHVAMARRVLLSDSGGGAVRRVSIPGVELPQGQPNVPIRFNAVGKDYFETMGTRLMMGRSFNPADNLAAGRVVVISKTMAERFWPGRQALGRSILVEGKPRQIVGVAEDAKVNWVHESPEPYMYFPMAQMPGEDGTLIVDSGNAGTGAVASIRSAIQAVDPNVPITTRTLLYLMQQAFWGDQMTAGFVGALALLGICLGAVGLYGVIAFVVNQRRREIGIRMALGAERCDILRLILGHALVLAVVGAAVGLVASFFTTRLMSAMLYGVKANDPLAFGGSLALVILVALAAASFPAGRAASIDPMKALRTE